MNRRRTLACAALLLVFGESHAQSFEALRRAVSGLQEQGLLPKPAQTRPVELVGTPTPPERSGELPPPQAGGNEQNRIQVLSNPDIESQGSLIHLTGGVEVLFRGYHIYAKEAIFDQDTNTAELWHEAKVVGEDEIIKGEHVIVNFDTHRFRATDTDSELRPALLQGNLVSDLYVRGKDFEGTEREIKGFDSRTTTCNYEKPHYEILSKYLTIRPGVRAIFRKFELRVLNKRIVRLPFFSVPLDEQYYDNLPEVGRTAVEGYYVRTHFPLHLRGDSVFYSRWDYYSKLGTGLGGIYKYQTKSVNGDLRPFVIIGQSNSVELNSTHHQQFQWGSLQLDNQYSKNNYLTSPNETIFSTRGQLHLGKQGGARNKGGTDLTYFQNGNQSPGFDTRQRTIGLRDLRYYGKPRTPSGGPSGLNFRNGPANSIDIVPTNTSFQANWVTNRTSFTQGAPVERQQVDVKFVGQHDLKSSQLELDYFRSIPVGQNSNFFDASEETPLLRLLSDNRRLFGPKNNALPFTTELSIGQFVDPSSKRHVSRDAFDFQFRKNKQKKRHTLNMNGRFRQGVYSDGTAQYLLDFNSGYNYRLGRDTEFNFRYHYLRPYGFTPLSIDRTGQTNLATSDVSYRPIRPFLIGAQAGYDGLQLKQKQTPWQQLSLRTDYTPWKELDFRTQSTYDPFQRIWSNVRLDFGYVNPRTNKSVTIGARYDGFRHSWDNVNGVIQGFRFGRVTTNLLFEYDGFLHRFANTQFAASYDLHDAELILEYSDSSIGFNSGRQINIFLRLKAFPFSSPFGIGRQGQAIGTGTGVRY